jgi:hypothetical protein
MFAIHTVHDPPVSLVGAGKVSRAAYEVLSGKNNMAYLGTGYRREQSILKHILARDLGGNK